MNQYDTETINALAAKRLRLDVVHDALLERFKGNSKISAQDPLSIIRNIADDLQECEQIIEFHGTNTMRVDDAVLREAAATIRDCHNVLTALTMFGSLKTIQL